ncbi:cation diffusion facilitator family transporter [Leptothoe sp. PORK10 BA2]|uniref:cation diffusion facilitator family transporter n=1 Tax=Leptothoe sp. PORK10 BA2 TaxID=3110254 RepID=UPI002B1F3C45|nr:cation diffusion facilitator family transporter [Leptothoe sp. PORK10 BA2]MEA5464173.1 cation diffusion facilitator family transporter [Leptothoe sp. PORK10 BA2]
MHNHGFGACDCPTDTSPQKLRVLAIALVMVAGFSILELKVSHHSHSLSLVADAGHMIADVFAIAMSLLAAWIAQWPTSPQAPFGYRRIEILAALVNGIGLLTLAVWIGQEAISQIQAPPEEILTTPMALTALAGLGVHGINAVLLHQHTDNDLNLRGAFLHTLADALSCLGVLFVAAAVHWLGWQWTDGGVSVAIALLIFTGAIPLIRQSLSILLEQTPTSINPEDIKQHLLTFGDITQVNQLRIWTIAPGQIHLNANLTVTGSPNRRDLLLHRLQTSLHNDFDISESTIQMRAEPAVVLSTLPNTKIRELIETGSTGLNSVVPVETEPNASRLLER